MPGTPRNAPCPCGSGRKYKLCHGSGHPAPAVPGQASLAPGPGRQTVENPFRRIFTEDGTVNQQYVVSRLEHLEELVKTNQGLFPLRYDRDRLEGILAERQDLFSGADDQEAFEGAFREFAELALPQLVTKEFDERVKEALRIAVNDPELTRRDRAAAACGLVLTLPAEGEAPQPPHLNPFFDMVLRVTFNESMARVELLQKLKEEKVPDLEREARLQEFFRSKPALLFEIQEGFKTLLRKAVTSYEKGEYSFGIGADMILRGLRAVRTLTQEYRDREGDSFTDTQKQEFSERFGQAITDAFAEDIGEDEEAEIFARMEGFLEEAREAKAKKAVKGLSSALEIMDHNPEIRHRLLLAAYHEGVTGSRLYREKAEEESAQSIFGEPFDVERYYEYGERLQAEGFPIRAERVYVAALEFFPEDAEVRQRLEKLGRDLEPDRKEKMREKLETCREEE